MKKLTIGLLGFGVVGSSIPVILAKSKEKIKQQTGYELVVKKALVRKLSTVKENPYKISLTTEAAEILNDPEIDVVVEVLGKIEPARTFIIEALKNGKHVVTANKDLLATHGQELTDLAVFYNRELYYEASVGGGIPILRTLSESFTADEITKVCGIVNGTTNYMLTQMDTKQKTYEEALQEAQAKGFAESDPTNDVAGFDAVYKTVILSKFAFGMTLDVKDVKRQGIENISLEDIKCADQLGYVIKLIGLIQQTDQGIFAEVAPMLIAKEHPLANVENEYNSVYVESFGIGSSMFYGPGAGAKPTATSVVSDLSMIAQHVGQKLPATPFANYEKTTKIAPETEISGCYYITCDQEIEVADLIEQQKTIAGQTIFLTKEIKQSQLAELLSTLEQKGHVSQVLRIVEG